MDIYAEKTYPYEVMNHPLAQSARIFAMKAHDSINHRRKYCNSPYWVHLEEVAMIVASVGGTVEQVCAAWAHDATEDVGIPNSKIEELFGPVVARYVENLTDVSQASDGNRTARKAIDRKHTAAACPEAKTIKLADLISNTKSICQHDKKFAKVYLEEKSLVLPFLKEGNAELWKRASEILEREKSKIY